MSYTTPQRIMYSGGAQAMRFAPFDFRSGRPTRVASVTYVIEDLTEGTTSSLRTVQASAAATLDSIDTTTTAAVGRSTADARSIPLTDATGVTAGRTYMLSEASSTGERELVTVDSVNGNTVVSRRRVMGTYAIGASFQGVELTGTFPSSVADDEDLAIEDGRDYQVTWVYTIDGYVHRIPQMVHIERYRVVPWASPEDLFRRMRSIESRFEPRDIEDALHSATQDVRAEVEGAGYPLESYRPSEVAIAAVVFDAIHILHMGKGGDLDADIAETHRERYKAMVHRLTEQRNYGARMLSRSDDESRQQGDSLDLFIET